MNLLLAATPLRGAAPADTLAKAAAAYLECLDRYDECIRGKTTSLEEDKCRDAALNAAGHLQQTIETLRQQWLSSDLEPIYPGRQPVVDLWQACVAYFDAQKRRTDAMTRFLNGEAKQDEADCESILTINAELAVRLALGRNNLSCE
jgi:hypothetical protein